MTYALGADRKTLLRAAYSNRQLEEILSDFWFNHFNVFFDKGADRYLTTVYERDAIRKHVFSKFHDLLHRGIEGVVYGGVLKCSTAVALRGHRGTYAGDGGPRILEG